MSRQQHKGDHRIVVGIDGSASSLEALQWAVRQAELTGATVDAVTAWQFPAAATGFGWAVMPSDTAYEEIAAKTLADAINKSVNPLGDARVRPSVVEGHPAQVLIDAAADADLLVVGSRGHGEFAGALLGSVSQHCVHHAACPVVVIRGRSEA